MNKSRLRIVRSGGIAVAVALLLSQPAIGQGLTPNDFQNVKTLKEAVEVAKERFRQDGKAEYAALLSEARVREAVRQAVKSYEALLGKGQENADQKEYFEKEIRPACLAIAEKGGWPPGCSFFSFYTLTDRRNGQDVAYDGLGLRLRIDTPQAKVKGFALPVLDLFFGRFTDSGK